MVNHLKINVDKSLTVYYLGTGDNQYPSNLVVYRPDHFCPDDLASPSLEDVKRAVNNELNGLYTNITILTPKNTSILNNPGIHSCIWSYPKSIQIKIDGNLGIELDKKQILIFENTFNHKIDIPFKKNNYIYHLFYLQKPIIKLRRR